MSRRLRKDPTHSTAKRLRFATGAENHATTEKNAGIPEMLSATKVTKWGISQRCVDKSLFEKMKNPKPVLEKSNAKIFPYGSKTPLQLLF